MYKGEINLAHDEIGPLLNVAEMLKIRGLADVKGDHDAIKLEHSSSLPEIIPVPKQAKHNDWDAAKIESLMRSVATASPSAAVITANTSPNPLQQRNQRKRNWSSIGGSSTITHSSNAAVNHINNNSTSRNANKNDNSSGSIGTTISNTMDGSDAQSQSSLAEDIPIEASPPPTPPTRNSAISIPDVSALSTGLGLSHTDSHSTDDMEIKPGIAEMIREEERVSLPNLFVCYTFCACFFLLSFSYIHALRVFRVDFVYMIDMIRCFGFDRWKKRSLAIVLLDIAYLLRQM